MNRLLTLMAALVLSLSAMAQGVYTQPCQDKKLEKKAIKWKNSNKWRNGFTAASPHETVNAAEFYTQYKRNPQWKALFAWLAKTDLMALPAGQHPIPGTTMKANVEDGENGDLEKRGTESHRQYVDFQYVVKGSERFGLLDHVTSRPKAPIVPTSSTTITKWTRPSSSTRLLTNSSYSSLATGILQRLRPTKPTRKYAS